MRSRCSGKLILLGYNMEGIRVQDFEACCNGLKREFEWHAIVAQEITKAKLFPREVGGCKVIAGVASGGARIPGLILRDDIIPYMISQPARLWPKSGCGCDDIATHNCQCLRSAHPNSA